MQYLGALIILVFCLPVVFLQKAMIKPMIGFAVVVLLFGIAGIVWPTVMPKNFVTENAWAANSPLQPEVATFFGGVCLLFGIGLLLAVGVRKLFIHLKVLKEK